MRRFNYVHSGCRMAVEHSFGQLKNKFQRLKFINVEEVNEIVDIIFAACVLHNVCKLNGDREDVIPEPETEDGSEPAEGEDERDGIALRNELMISVQ